MKKVFLLFVMFSLMLLTSCSNDFSFETNIFNDTNEQEFNEEIEEPQSISEINITQRDVNVVTAADNEVEIKSDSIEYILDESKQYIDVIISGL
jgi:major membrane immunogen (membrane-anchored lipoprotein)